MPKSGSNRLRTTKSQVAGKELPQTEMTKTTKSGLPSTKAVAKKAVKSMSIAKKKK